MYLYTSIGRYNMTSTCNTSIQYHPVWNGIAKHGKHCTQWHGKVIVIHNILSSLNIMYNVNDVNDSVCVLYYVTGYILE